MKYVVCTFLVALGIGAFIACSDSPQPIICHDIPAGGCPSENGAACSDPTCSAAYLCNLADGTWVFDHACPGVEGGVADASSDAPHEGSSSQGSRDASFDAPPGSNGGPGCAPLEQPDCALGDALACPAGSCCNCEDLFVCQNGGWNHWGACNPASGAITPDK